MPDYLLQEVREASLNRLETAGVLLASIITDEDTGNIRLLGREIQWVPAQCYVVRECDEMTITSEGYVHALARAESIGAVCLWLHTHPGSYGVPLPSVRDAKVDELLAELFRLRSGSPYYGTVIFSPRDTGIAFSGYIQAEGADLQAIDRILAIGSRLRLVQSFSFTEKPGREILGGMFDRNIRAFGSAVQNTLRELTFAVIGCGGTGSAVAEQLVRMGARKIMLVDPKCLTETNLTRVYGAYASDVGRPKVEVTRDHLLRIAPELDCRVEISIVTNKATARRVANSDVIFGCTDDNAGRMILSRLSTYMLMPVFDCGVLLSSGANGILSGIDGRVTVLHPGAPCLLCRGRIDLQKMASELLPDDEREHLVKEGYAPALGGSEPSVVAFTTMVAASAVSELLERLIGYGIDPAPSEVLLRLHDREMSTNIAVPKEKHFCHPESGLLGAGITTPFLGRVWGND
jgi:molybdopterin/thiamine biosynthesis adenylyltransferase